VTHQSRTAPAKEEEARATIDSDSMFSVFRTGTYTGSTLSRSSESTEKSPGFVRARNRWHLAYTLLNNPEITKERMHGPHVEPAVTKGVDATSKVSVRCVASYAVYGAANSVTCCC